MDNSITEFNPKFKRKKFVNASAIVTPKNVTSNSMLDGEYGNTTTIPIKINFVCSKDPVGVGRFGVVYKISNIAAKLLKKDIDSACDVHPEDKEEAVKNVSNFENMAVKIIVNKSAPNRSYSHSKALKREMTKALKRNKELSILKSLDHQNVIRLVCYTCDDIRKHCVEDSDIDNTNLCDYETTRLKENYISMFLSYMPTTLQLYLEQFGSLLRGVSSEKKRLGLTLVKQLFDAVGYIKSINVCHRDIKPSNILINIDERKLKLSDFGSAIRIPPKTNNQQLEQIKKQSLQSYVCSRYYRAPELLLGCSNYSHEIDTWSAGCVVAEMVMAKPLFPGIEYNIRAI